MKKDLKNIDFGVVVSELRKNFQVRILRHEPLAAHTSFGIGGNAQIYLLPFDRTDIPAIVRFLNENGVPIFIVGFGTNLLVSDKGFDGCVVDLSIACRDINYDGDILTSGSGVWGNDLIRRTAELGLAGMEGLGGVPGGLGGWLHMNAGAFGVTVSDDLIEVETVDLEGVEATIDKASAGFSYRRAEGLHDKILLGASWHLKSESGSKVLERIEETITKRYNRRIMTLPSCGSTFKNPVNGFYAAKMIEATGCKGLRVGGVEVSHNHANFIINIGGGRASDVMSLVRIIRKRVFDEYGVNLELELQLLGIKDER